MSHVTEVIDKPPVVENNFSKDGPKRKCSSCCHFEYTDKENNLGICNNVDFILERMAYKDSIQKKIKELEDTKEDIITIKMDNSENSFHKILSSILSQSAKTMALIMLKAKFRFLEISDPHSNVVKTDFAEDCEYFEKTK